MELKEAVKLAKTLAEQFAGLSKVGDALTLLEGGDKKLKELMAQKESLEVLIAARRQELSDTDQALTQDLEIGRAHV